MSPIRRRRRTSRYRACAALTRSPCCSSVARAASSAFAGPDQVARDERDLGFGDDAPRAGHGLFRTEGTRSTSQEGPSLERDRRAAPSRCPEAREPARRRAGRPASMRRGDHPRRAHCAAAGDQRVHPPSRSLRTSLRRTNVGIPSHLSLHQPPAHMSNYARASARQALKKRRQQ